MGEKDYKYPDEIKHDDIIRQLEKLNNKLKRKVDDILNIKRINNKDKTP